MNGKAVKLISPVLSIIFLWQSLGLARERQERLSGGCPYSLRPLAASEKGESLIPEERRGMEVIARAASEIQQWNGLSKLKVLPENHYVNLVVTHLDSCIERVKKRQAFYRELLKEGAPEIVKRTSGIRPLTNAIEKLDDEIWIARSVRERMENAGLEAFISAIQEESAELEAILKMKKNIAGVLRDITAAVPEYGLTINPAMILISAPDIWILNILDMEGDSVLGFAITLSDDNGPRNIMVISPESGTSRYVGFAGAVYTGVHEALHHNFFVSTERFKPEERLLAVIFGEAMVEKLTERVLRTAMDRDRTLIRKIGGRSISAKLEQRGRYNSASAWSHIYGKHSLTQLGEGGSGYMLVKRSVDDILYAWDEEGLEAMVLDYLGTGDSARLRALFGQRIWEGVVKITNVYSRRTGGISDLSYSNPVVCVMLNLITRILVGAKKTPIRVRNRLRLCALLLRVVYSKYQKPPDYSFENDGAYRESAKQGAYQATILAGMDTCDDIFRAAGSEALRMMDVRKMFEGHYAAAEAGPDIKELDRKRIADELRELSRLEGPEWLRYREGPSDMPEQPAVPISNPSASSI